MSSNNKTRDMLKEAGLYCTTPRLAILQALLEADGPLSQDAIAQTLSSTPDKATIYRTLTSLMEANLVHKAYIDERAAYYETADHCSDSQCHPHFTCTVCGKTHCLTDLKIPMAPADHQGFQIKRQQVRLEGICPACR